MQPINHPIGLHGVVQIMKDGGFSANSTTVIYDDCNIIWSGFQDISIEHCGREANQVAQFSKKTFAI